MAIANAKSETEKEAIKAGRWVTFARQIRFLGWLKIVAPVVVGAFATLALYLGLLTLITCCN